MTWSYFNWGWTTDQRRLCHRRRTWRGAPRCVWRCVAVSYSTAETFVLWSDPWVDPYFITFYCHRSINFNCRVYKRCYSKYSHFRIISPRINPGGYIYSAPDYIPFRIISHLFGTSVSSLTQWNIIILILIISPFGLYPVYQQYSFPPKNGI